MMTQHQKLLAEELFGRISGLTPQQSIERLIEAGFVDIRACERAAMRSQIDRLWRGGMARVVAMETVAELFCCSYAKVRALYYNQSKT